MEIALKQLVFNIDQWSSRGVKQGNPISPTLFIIAAEVLTRCLNKLHEKPSFIGYGMPKWSPQINHLSYAGDAILFYSGDGYSLNKMMKRLRKYEKASGQLVNTDKSCYYVHHKVSARVNSKIKRHTNMRNGSFPFTYLGCPVFYGRRKQIYYEDLIKKVMKRILPWQNRLLSFGDVEEAYGVATSEQMRKKWHPTMVVDRGGSHTWKKMVIIRDAVEPQIFWYLRNGTSSFWYKNWTRLGIENWLKHIKDNIKVPDGEEDDEPCWMLETNGKFSVKSAWEFLRHKESKQTSYRLMWEKGLPIKISFFMWRVWKGRISTDDILKRMMINIPSRSLVFVFLLMELVYIK
ncbi:uncharacterized protein LOC132057756 [Lycium ferocissimum]|uniref:uncharacterized protein LOC132057756 n=1 Tax=Lycium ferocissimum TaxID=112874 RepID=UPI0028166841|nr:uncharacterized protein LOC132057756 [Lycium ferocissimum]